MKTLKQIHKEVEEYLNKQPDILITPKQQNEYINTAMEELFRYCIVCNKKLKNATGVHIHMSKVHAKNWKLAKLDRMIRHYPVTNTVKVYWDNNKL
jgi:uncharacterized protein YueI